MDVQKTIKRFPGFEAVPMFLNICTVEVMKILWELVGLPSDHCRMTDSDFLVRGAAFYNLLLGSNVAVADLKRAGKFSP